MVFLIYSDMDFGTNAEIEYHKLDGNGSSFVNVDSSSGQYIPEYHTERSCQLIHMKMC